MPSQTIDRYEVKAALGRGGMATVYHAYDPRFERDVAIKVMPREFLHDPTFRARFEREAKTIAALEHWAIVPVYDFGEHDEQPYLVMRYMPGGSLSDRIKEGPISLKEATDIMERIGAALDTAHRRDVIHRDVKPGNILFDQEGGAYLSDFGIVKVSEATAQLTGSGIVGTPAYMAPEMAEPGGTSSLIDIYALGVTLYEMLAGKPPYDADTPAGLMMAHVTRPVPNVRKARSDLPNETQLVLARAMAKDPTRRYQNATELTADLQAVAAGQAPSIMEIEEEAPPETMPLAQADIPQTVAVPSGPELATVEQAVEVMPPAGRAQPGVGVPQAPPVPAAPPAERRGIPIWVWVAGGGLVALLCIGVVGLLLAVGFGGGDEIAALLGFATATPTPTFTPTPTNTPTITPTPTNTPTPTPVGGGSGRIAFVSTLDGDYEVYVMNIDGSDVVRLTNNSESEYDPIWSPDGSKIAFRSKRDGNFEIYVMNADGSNQTRLTHNDDYD